MKRLSFYDKRLLVLIKFLCENDKLAHGAVSYFFEDIDGYLMDIINAGLNFEGERGQGYNRINFKKDSLLNYNGKNSDMLEITKITNGNKVVLGLYYGLLHKGVTLEELSPFVLMEIKGVFNEEEILNEDFEYRNTFFWGTTKSGELERYIDSMIGNKATYSKFKIVSPLRTDILEDVYSRKQKPEQIENNYNLFGDSLLMRSGYLPYYNDYKQMFTNEVMQKRREIFWGLREEDSKEK